MELSITINSTPAPTWYLDADNDNYFTGRGVTQCTSPGAGFKTSGLLGVGDCNDGNGAINPDAAEICSNGIDENCNSLIDENNITTPVGVNQGPAGVCRGATGQVLCYRLLPGL